MKKNWFFILLLAIASLALAGTAAYFSVFGLSKLFISAGLGITILAASLEFAKLVTVSYVYRFWKDIKKGLRVFYVFAVVFIMLLTSIGIYGFLTGAYQQSANTLEMRDSQIQIAENKKALFVGQLERINTSITSSSTRIQTLSELRNNQEARMDTLYARNYITMSRNVEKQIDNSDKQIEMLNIDITEKMEATVSVNDSIASYDQKIINLKMSDVSNEIGPYKFVANLTGLEMDRVVNIVALLIVVVFDPLAITLLIGVNQLTMTDSKTGESSAKKMINKLKGRRKEEDEEIINDPVEEEPVKEVPVEELLEEPVEEEPVEEEPVEEEPVEEEPVKEVPVEELLEEPVNMSVEEPVEVQEFLTTTTKPETDENDNGIKQITSFRGNDTSPKFIPRGHIQKP